MKSIIPFLLLLPSLVFADQFTDLKEAVTQRDAARINLIMAEDPNLKWAITWDQHPALEALETGDIETMKFILTTDLPMTIGLGNYDEQQSFLYFAIKKKDTAMVRSLLDNGYALNQSQLMGGGGKDLSYAFSRGNDEIVGLILDAGADVISPTYHYSNGEASAGYYYPISSTLSQTSTVSIERMIEKGATINCVSSSFYQFGFFGLYRSTPMDTILNKDKISPDILSYLEANGGKKFSQLELTFDEAKLLLPIVTAKSSTERLRMRTDPSLSSATIDILIDTEEALVLESTRETMTIDKLTSVWYRIIKENNATGWVFGGYLKIDHPFN